LLLFFFDFTATKEFINQQIFIKGKQSGICLLLANCSKLFHTSLMKKIFLLLLVVSCARTNVKNISPPSSEMRTSNTASEKTLVFIQGFHLDEKSWGAVISNIPKNEFLIHTIARANSDKPKAATLKAIAKRGCQGISADSILVAHSFGGAIANQMFGYCPQKILKIIYISAIVPFNDELPFARMSDEKAQAHYAQAVTFEEHVITPKDPETFYKVMDSEVAYSAANSPKVYPEQTSLSEEELIYNEDKFKVLPKAYIMTTKDNVVSKDTQLMYIKDAAIENVGKISTGHFPMISAPEDLADLILKLAQ
jgi:pimeloyl-ACP methyl ester carboxylesterase